MNPVWAVIVSRFVLDGRWKCVLILNSRRATLFVTITALKFNQRIRKESDWDVIARAIRQIPAYHRVATSNIASE